MPVQKTAVANLAGGPGAVSQSLEPGIAIFLLQNFLHLV